MGKGFVRLGPDGRPTGGIMNYRDVTDGWSEMHFRPTLGEAFSDIGAALPCPGCGSSSSECVSRTIPFLNRLSARIECLRCGHTVMGVTTKDARKRWNTECGNSLKLIGNIAETPERGL